MTGLIAFFSFVLGGLFVLFVEWLVERRVRSYEGDDSYLPLSGLKEAVEGSQKPLTPLKTKWYSTSEPEGAIIAPDHSDVTDRSDLKIDDLLQ